MEFLEPKSQKDLWSAAQLVYLADQYYFDIFSNDKEVIIRKIFETYPDDRTDFSRVKAIYCDNNLIGAIVYYPTAEQHLRQSFSLSYLTAGCDYSLRTLKKFNEEAGNVDGEGLYLSRIAINTKFRGRGIGKRALRLLFKIALAEGHKNLLLHVRFDNWIAIKCYSSLGFKNKNINCQKNYKQLEKNLTKNISEK